MKMLNGILKGKFLGYLIPALSFLILLFSLMPGQFFSQSAINYSYQNMPLHSMLEAFSSFSFLLLGVLLYLKYPANEINYNVALSLSFLSMGILIGFHAALSIDDNLVLTKSFANLIGSLWLIVLLIPSLNSYVIKKRIFITIINVFVVFFWGLFISLNDHLLPVGIVNGSFSEGSLIVNNISALLFLAATFQLYIIYRKYKLNNYLIYSLLASLLAGSSFIFNHSWIGTHVWWIMHIFTTGASLIAFGLLFTEYSLLIKNYHGSIEFFNKKNENIDYAQNQTINLFQNVTDTIIIFDGNKIVECNKKALEFFEIADTDNWI